MSFFEGKERRGAERERGETQKREGGESVEGRE